LFIYNPPIDVEHLGILSLFFSKNELMLQWKPIHRVFHLTQGYLFYQICHKPDNDIGKIGWKMHPFDYQRWFAKSI